MTIEEIDKRINDGESLIMYFGIRSNSYRIGESNLTYRQFTSAKKRFENKLKFTMETGGITKHIYTIN